MKLVNKNYSIFLTLFLFCLLNSCNGSSKLSCIFNKITIEEDDSCVVAGKIKNTIVEFINGENELIYEEDFVSSFLKINKYHNDCYFPRKREDVKLYYFLGDSVLLKEAEKDKRAMKLLIELYLVNKNSAELSEYYGSRIIPTIASKNITFFINVLVEKSEREANKCISKLKYIDNVSEIDKIINDIDKINDNDYLMIINKIKETLPTSSSFEH